MKQKPLSIQALGKIPNNDEILRVINLAKENAVKDMQLLGVKQEGLLLLNYSEEILEIELLTEMEDESNVLLSTEENISIERIETLSEVSNIVGLHNSEPSTSKAKNRNFEIMDTNGETVYIDKSKLITEIDNEIRHVSADRNNRFKCSNENKKCSRMKIKEIEKRTSIFCNDWVLIKNCNYVVRVCGFKYIVDKNVSRVTKADVTFKENFYEMNSLIHKKDVGMNCLKYELKTNGDLVLNPESADLISVKKYLSHIPDPILKENPYIKVEFLSTILYEMKQNQNNNNKRRPLEQIQNKGPKRGKKP